MYVTIVVRIYQSHSVHIGAIHRKLSCVNLTNRVESNNANFAINNMVLETRVLGLVASCLENDIRRADFKREQIG